MRITEGKAGLVKQGKSRGPRHDEVDRKPGVEQTTQNRCGVRSSARSGDPDHPRLPHPPSPLLSRSTKANPNSVMPTKPLVTKKERLTRDRSSALTMECS